MRRHHGSPEVVSYLRAGAALLGVGIFATGVLAVFVTENGTGSAALLTIGAALAVVAVLGDRIQAIEMYGVSLTIKDMARETFALAKEADRRGHDETAERLRLVGQELRDLASEYRRLRTFRSRGAERTAALEEVILRARETAQHQALEPAEVWRWFDDGEAEARVVVLGLMEGDPGLRDLEAAVDAIEHSRSAFEQYHGFLLAAIMLVPEVAATIEVEPGPELKRGERDQLAFVVKKALQTGRIQRSSHRREYAEIILAALEEG